MSVFLEITRIAFDGFSKTAIWKIYMESLQIIDKFCSSPLANFLNMAYIFMQDITNAKQ